MQRQLEDYLTPVTNSIDSLKKYLSDKVLVTDLTIKFVITFGVVLLMGGLYLMATDPGSAGSPAQASNAIQTVVTTINWVPGIPFYIGNLNCGASIIGLVSWLVGLDILLVGLGLWVRHRLARYVALGIFALSACFQFAQLFFYGIESAPSSMFVLLLDLAFIYFLLTRFDMPKQAAKSLKAMLSG